MRVLQLFLVFFRSIPNNIQGVISPCANHHDMRVLQLLHPLGHTLGPEPLPITTLTIARTVVTDGYFPIVSNSREPFLPEPDGLDDAITRPVLGTPWVLNLS